MNLGKGYTTFLITIQLYMMRVEGGKEEVREKERARASPLNMCIVSAIPSALPSGRVTAHALC